MLALLVGGGLEGVGWGLGRVTVLQLGREGDGAAAGDEGEWLSERGRGLGLDGRAPWLPGILLQTTSPLSPHPLPNSSHHRCGITPESLSGMRESIVRAVSDYVDIETDEEIEVSWGDLVSRHARVPAPGLCRVAGPEPCTARGLPMRDPSAVADPAPDPPSSHR